MDRSQYRAIASDGSFPTTEAAPEHTIVGDLKDIWAELVDYRFLLFQLAKRDIRIRYKQAVMGFFWAVFMPALIVLAGLLVKYAMAYFSGTEMETESIGALAVKALPWGFFVGAMNFSTNALIGNMHLVTKIYFPREVLPLSATLAQTFDSSIGTAALLLVLPFLGLTVSLQLLWAPVMAVLLFLFTAGVCLFLSAANLFFRDVKYIVQVLLTFGIFFTPVFFEPSMFGPQGAQILMLNPMSPFLEGIRLSMMEGHNLLHPLTVTDANGLEVLSWTPWYLAYGAATALLVSVGSAITFHRLEYVFAEYA